MCEGHPLQGHCATTPCPPLYRTIKSMTSAPMPILPVVPEPAPVPPQHPPVSREEIAAWLVIAAGFVFVMLEHVVLAFVGGLILYLILDRVAQSLSKRFPA